jgi:hypothetical protein
MSKTVNDLVNFGFICIRSLVWKGWHVVYHNKEWISLYVGLGWKYGECWYYPNEPEGILGESQEQAEYN